MGWRNLLDRPGWLGIIVELGGTMSKVDTSVEPGAEIAKPSVVKPVEETLTPAEIIKTLVEKVGKQLAKGEAKATLGDYLKLLQLQKEMKAEEPRDIRIRWVSEEEMEEWRERDEAKQRGQ